MARVIRCECGYVAHGATEEDLLAEADRHIRAGHPDLVGRVNQEALLDMAEEV